MIGRLAMIALVLLGAACSGSSGGTGTSAAGVDPQDAALEFARCMREQGIDMPDPSADGRGFVMRARRAGDGPSEEFEAANEACRHLLPDLAEELTPEERAEMEDRMVEFARCMREHGVEITDPTNGRLGIRVRRAPASGGAARIDDDFREAQEACEDLMPFPGRDREIPLEAP